MTNDYLTGLAKRTLGLLPVAQPLITPSFASVPVKMNGRPEITFNDNDPPEYQEATAESPSHETKQIFPLTESISHQTEPSMHDPVLIKTFPVPGKNTKSQENPDNDFIGTKTVSGPELFEQRKPETEIKIQGTVQKEHTYNEAMQKMDLLSEERTLGSSDQVSYRSYYKLHEKESANNIEKSVLEGKRQAFSVKPSKVQTIAQAKRDPDLAADFNGIRTFSKATENGGQRTTLMDPLSGSRLERIADASSGKYEPGIKSSDKNVTEIPISPVIKRYEEQKNFIEKGNLNRFDFARKEKSSLPTVKVTIGRVEVRTVTALQVLRPPPVRKNPKLSLDEYLKQHNG